MVILSRNPDRLLLLCIVVAALVLLVFIESDDAYSTGDCTIILQSEGESDRIITGDFGKTVSVEDPVREGYDFVGWSPELPSVFYQSESTHVAQWELKYYSLIIDKMDGTGQSIRYIQYTDPIDPLDVPFREGYVFDGWFGIVPSTMPAHDVIVTATWIPLEIRISFNTAGGNNIDDIVQETDSVLVLPSDPVKEGFTFTGWSPVMPTKMPPRDTTYTAIWQRNSYSVSCYDGGVLIRTIVDEYETSIDYPILEKEGYHPDWGPITTVPAENISVYVNWVINQHSLSFVLPGGNVDSIHEYDSRITAPSPGHREGYYFEGWNPAVPDFMPDRDLTFEPVWRPTVKSGEGADAGRFITGSGDSVIVAPLDLKGYDRVTFGVEGRWAVTFDPSFASGEGNLRMTLKEVSAEDRSNIPRGTKALYLIEIEDNGKRITSVPSPMEIGIEMDPGKGDPFVSIMEGDDPVPAGEVAYSDGKVSFSTSSLTYMAAGFTVPDDEGFPAMPTAVAIAAIVAVAAIASVVLFRRERKV